jgi:hypothetical protein
VARASVVPAVRAFQRDLIQPLHEQNRQRRIEARQQSAKRGAHDPPADQQDIYFIFGHRGIIRNTVDLVNKYEMRHANGWDAREPARQGRSQVLRRSIAEGRGCPKRDLLSLNRLG